MKVCGVELKGNYAIICVMQRAIGLFDIPHVRVPKISIKDASDSEEMKGFQFAFAKLLSDYKIDTVVIKGRALKGKFSGGPVGFKMEAAIQLINEVDVKIVSSSYVKSAWAKTQVNIDFRDTGLKSIQENAFSTAFAYFENN